MAEQDKQSAEQKSQKSANTQSPADQPDENQLKVIAAIGYLGILFILPLLMFPKNKFAIFHANQGLLLFLAGIVGGVAVSVLAVITLGIGALLWPVVWLFLVVLLIMGVVNALGGKMQRLPLIGNFDILKVQG